MYNKTQQILCDDLVGDGKVRRWKLQ